MEFTVFSLIYLLTAVLSFFVAVLSWQRKNIVASKELFLLAMSVAICAYFLFFEASSTDYAKKILFSKISYVGVVTVPVFYFLFVLRFTRLKSFKDLRVGWLLFIFPFITLILAFTNEYHHLIWSGFSKISQETNIMQYFHGFWFWIGYVLYSYILLIISTFYLFNFNNNNKKKKAFRGQGWLVLFAGICPWIISVFYLTGNNIVKGLDITPISTTLSAVLFTLAIMRSRFLNLAPIARETLVETLPVGIIALDDLYRIQDINYVARLILGVESEEVLGLHPTQAFKTSEKLLEAVLSMEPTIQVDINKNEVFKSFRIIKQPLKVLQGSQLITIYDITEEITRQKELTVAKLKAEENDNLKTAFLANMSHEIRTPLNCIMGFISILQSEKLSKEENKEYLEIVKVNGERLIKTINDIVDISKIESGQVQINYSEFDVNEILVNMYGFFRNEAEAKKLDFKCPEPVPYEKSLIRTDKEKLYSIITNLVKNSIKYTMAGFVKYDFSVNEKQLDFFVSDSGIGISEEKQQVIFERFVQVDTSRKPTIEGSGLGLAISKAYVEMLGGKIRIESEVDKGSTFYVSIPIEHFEQKE